MEEARYKEKLTSSFEGKKGKKASSGNKGDDVNVLMCSHPTGKVCGSNFISNKGLPQDYLESCKNIFFCRYCIEKEDQKKKTTVYKEFPTQFCPACGSRMLLPARVALRENKVDIILECHECHETVTTTFYWVT